MPVFVADRAEAIPCCSSLTRVALLGSTPTRSNMFGCDPRTARFAATARTASAPEAKRPRFKALSRPLRLRQASSSAPRLAPSAPHAAAPWAAREAVRLLSSSSTRSSESRPSKAFLPLSPRMTVAMRSSACSSDTPGTKLMTTTSRVHSSCTGFGTRTLGKVSLKFSCTRPSALASSSKFSSRSIQSLKCLVMGLSSGMKSRATSLKVQ
mmetsp:Transcript_50299/g.145873  ORF Transcript_50299/g.145873 Transcript_50299/m.145873 type:complete len:210 (+) Transcript_50299:762-1391(+)